MVDVTVLCVGKLKEKFYTDAAAEYLKRLSAFARVTVTELPESRRGLEEEGKSVLAAIPKGSEVAALCIEGEEMSSEALAERLRGMMNRGASRLCFVIGGSEGLSKSVKDAAALRLSMSRMTFPHHLARVMLLEQLYRAFSILNGGKYHK